MSWLLFGVITEYQVIFFVMFLKSATSDNSFSS